MVNEVFALALLTKSQAITAIPFLIIRFETKIERAAVANSPDLARPPNMSISAYVHMLIDQKLITRDIGLEYIAGYEQARFGGSRNDPSPVTMSPFQPQQLQPQPSQRHHHNHHHHLRHHTLSGRHVRQTSGLNPRHSQQSQSHSQHPNHDRSTASTIGGTSQHLPIIGSSVGGGSGGNGTGTGTGGRENLEEEDYIRFMKVLSWILQELGWDQAAEEAYEEEFRAQERQREAEQQQLHQAQYQQEEVYERGPDERETEQTTDYYHSDEGGSMMRLQPRRKQSQLSGDSYFIVGSSRGIETDPQFQPHQQQHLSQQGQGLQSHVYPNEGGSQNHNRRMGSASVGIIGSTSNSTGAGIPGGNGSATSPSAGPRKLSKSGNLSTRSLMTMRTMRTASSIKSWEQRP